MTIELRKMSPQEFDTYLSKSIPSYADDKMENEGLSAAEAKKIAEQSFNDLLPDGLLSPDQFLYSVYSGNQQIGILWFAKKESHGKKFAWIYDIMIESEFRGRGHGKEIMIALESEVKRVGLNSISLHVFGKNSVAQSLYKKVGYAPTNIVMRKNLD